MQLLQTLYTDGMSRITAINRQRISWCCADFGITYEELADEAKISREAFKKIMAGEQGITPRQLEAVFECSHRCASR